MMQRKTHTIHTGWGGVIPGCDIIGIDKIQFDGMQQCGLGTGSLGCYASIFSELDEFLYCCINCRLTTSIGLT